MVSRMKDDPEALIAGCEKLIERKVEERGRAQDAVKSAHVLLALPEGGPNVVHASIPRPPDGTLTIPERWKAAKWLDELERDHEPFATIKKAEEKLHKAIEAGREKIESPTDAIQTLKDELKQIEADHHDHFRKRAEEGSRSGDAQLDKLLAVFDETTQALGDMWSRWTRVNTPISTRGDLGHIRRELEEVRKGCCWPGHTEANYRESQQASPPAPKLTNREARTVHGGRGMSEEAGTTVHEQPASVARAARRVDFAVRALIAAALDLQAVGASGAGNAIADEADRLEGLAGEVRELKVRWD